MLKNKRFHWSGIHWPNLEDSLEQWVIEERAKGLPVLTVWIYIQNKITAEHMGNENFISRLNWCF